MANFYVKSGSGVTAFAQSTAYNSGDRIVKLLTDAGTNNAVASRWVWECTTGGTTAAANPTWPASVTQDVTTVTSGTAVFTARRPGYSSGTTANWTFATPYLKYGAAAATTAGDVVYVSNNHSESQSASYDISTVAGTNYVCVEDNQAPPISLATGALVQTTGLSNLTFNSGSGSVSYVYGLRFKGGSGSVASTLHCPIGVSEKCVFELGTTATDQTVTSASGSSVGVVWKNCSVVFQNASQRLAMAPAYTFQWLGGSISGAAISQLFANSPVTCAIVRGVDFSTASASMNFQSDGSNAYNALIQNCKLPSSWSGSVNTSNPGMYHAKEIHNSDSTGTGNRYQRKSTFGLIVSETVIVKSSGANDGVSGLSWKLVSLSTATSYARWLDTGEIVAWNDVIGTTRTVTIDILRDSATGLTDQEMWIEVSYLSSTGSPLGALVSSAPSILAAPTTLAASSATWTTTGMSNPNAQKISVSFTPQMKGFVHVKVYLAKASTTVYVDPALTLS